MRIEFYSGAGGGKTTTAHWLFAELKREGHSVEFAREYIKKYTYMNVDPATLDQQEIFENQLLEESIPLDGGVSNIVTECPLHLSHIYARLYSTGEIADQIQDVCRAFDWRYPSVSVFLERGDKPYKAEGRWGSLEQAKRVDGVIREYLSEAKAPLLISDWTKLDQIKEFATYHINS